MAEELELERTYLLMQLPKGLKKCKSLEIIDVYIPDTKPHPVMRIRKKGGKMELTKKVPNNNDASNQTEHTIHLSEDEFNALCNVPGKKVRKLRYYFPVKNTIAEIDVFQDKLLGLILVDFEFSNLKDKENFIAPDFCSEDITQEEFIAGGYLAGKSYTDIRPLLKKYNYEKINSI
jgi:adenylate cyclase